MKNYFEGKIYTLVWLFYHHLVLFCTKKKLSHSLFWAQFPLKNRFFFGCSVPMVQCCLHKLVTMSSCYKDVNILNYVDAKYSLLKWMSYFFWVAYGRNWILKHILILKIGWRYGATGNAVEHLWCHGILKRWK